MRKLKDNKWKIHKNSLEKKKNLTVTKQHQKKCKKQSKPEKFTTKVRNEHNINCLHYPVLKRKISKIKC